MEAEAVAANSPLERGNAPGRATRVLLMQTAEELFAARGIGGVSLREIGQRCGQRNNAAAQYHFGTKHRLVRSIYEFRTPDINRRRVELIAASDEPLERLDTVDLVRLILLPHFENLARPDIHFVGFLARLLTDDGSMQILQTFLVDEHQAAVWQVEAALRSKSPLASDPERYRRRFTRVIGWAIHSLAEIDIAPSDPDPDDLDDLVETLALALS